LDDGRALHVALIEPEIHFNTGNAGRTCLAAGARLHLVEPLGFSLESSQLRRGGLDYWPRVKPRLWPSWRRFAAALPELGEPWLLTPEAPRTLWDARFQDRVVLLFGRESVGLPAELRAAWPERLIRIPMDDPGLRSLNLSTSVGISSFEVRRQWAARPRAGP
jgi:tRNA (cytidine/uridine-2'-O-)-methyltransferase